ncbi:MAG: YvcK family protein [Anaerolineae bacterium]|nr:YvcK family protein [Anaerolineae bacterium]MCO5205054.1 YvcK family protein [Anaerolineae bacterium]
MLREWIERIRHSWRSARLWLIVGIGVKRWLVVLIAASAFLGMGLVFLLFVLQSADILPQILYQALTLRFLPLWLRVLLPIVVGTIVILLAIVRLSSNLLEPFRPPDKLVAESLLFHRQLDRGPRIVAIGGGTGMPGLLRGLRQYTRNITAIVTVADDGGSSGRLRRELGLLPPGDFRNNIAALARDEALMTQLMQYRFGDLATTSEPSQLQGHAFGNLLLAALTGITGSFDEALLAMERVLAMRGRVVPSTLDEVTLVAEVEVNGRLQHVAGESAIPEAHGRVLRVALEPQRVRAYPPALRAILTADLIIMGPGSLYTSVLPNLLVPDLAEALRHAAAPKVYVCNLAAQPGETDDYTVADHVAALVNHVSADFIDLVLANDNLSIPPETGGGATIYVQPVAYEGVKMVTADLVDEQRPWRHDGAKVAQCLMSLLEP